MFTLPELAFAYDALEPHIDTATMHLHHDKHHATYITNLNTALENFPEYQNMPLEELLTSINSLPETLRTPVTNNGGGHANHTLFWESLTPGGASQPQGSLKEALEASFGSIAQFQEEMSKKALTVFGSGWVWLVMHEGALQIITTPNQNSPLMTGDIPLLGIDVWEHAYYLLYNNRRADYLSAIWHVINWDRIDERYRQNS